MDTLRELPALVLTPALAVGRGPEVLFWKERPSDVTLGQIWP